MAELTTRAIQAIKPGPRREIPDGRVGGLYCVVGSRGATSWVLRYRRPDTGKHAVMTLGRVYTGDDAPEPVIGGPLTLAGARRLALQAKGAIDIGRDPGREKQDARSERRSLLAETFADALDEYDRRHLSKLRTGAHVRQNIELECGTWMDKPVRSITRREVIDMLDGIVDRGSPVKANRTRDYLNAMFNWAMQREVVESNPVRDAPKPAREQARSRVHTDDELALVWNATASLSVTAGAMARVLILTGQRLGSVEAMRWADVDLDDATWTIPAEDMKMGAEHAVPLAPGVVDILRPLPRVGDLVFPGRNGDRRNGRSRFRSSWIKASGVADWSPHDLRRTMASGMARIGVALHVVELILDHRPRALRGVAGVYMRHDFAAEQRHALNLWADHVMRLVDDTNVVPLHAG